MVYLFKRSTKEFLETSIEKADLFRLVEVGALIVVHSDGSENYACRPEDGKKALKSYCKIKKGLSAV